MDSTPAAPKRVCVTGATGYVASHVVLALLRKGYTVVGTVRSLVDTKKYAFLQRLATEIGAASRLTLAEADNLIPGSFNKAFDGCMCVIHMASPFIMGKVDDPQKELIDPAVKGTANVLTCVSAHPSIKRVVLTSSVAAIYGHINDKPSQIYTEEDWNETSTIDSDPYSLSKTLAERKAWEMASKQSQYTLVTVNPSFVMGPSLNDRESSASHTFIKDMLAGKNRFGVPHIEYGFVDVRDVAEAHVAAMENTSAKGRHICSQESKSLLEVAKILKQGFPNNALPTVEIPKPLMWAIGPMVGVSWEEIRRDVNRHLEFDNTKIKKDLGIKFTRSMRDSLLDMGQTMLDDGLVEKK